MLKGILGGGFWGTVLMGVSLATASLVAEQPAGNAPPSSPVFAPPGGLAAVAPEGTDPDLPARVADAGGAPQPSDTPQVTVDTTVARDVTADTAAPETPDAAQTTAGLAVPPVSADTPIDAGTEAPVLPNPQAAAPRVPVQEADIRLETTTPPLPEPAPDPVPVTVIEDAAPPGIVIIDGDVAAQAPATVAGITATPAAPETPEAPAGPVVVADPVASEPTQPVSVAEPVPDPANAVPGTDTSPADDPTEPEIIVIIEPQGSGTEDDATGDATDPETDPEPQADTEDAPRIALRGEAATLPGTGGAIRVIRSGDTATDADDAATEAAAEVDPDLPALIRFAAPLDNPEDRPLMAVILIDAGALAGAVPAVAGVPFDLTVAIDPAVPGAADRMLAYRAAGIEVLVLARVPSGATPSDAEVALEAAFAQVPEAVGLLDTAQTGLQGDGAVVAQAMARLAADGRGYVTAPQGLTPSLRAADAADVPSGLIYRDLDSDGQSAQVIRRFLDQAAFRARQQEGVILLGRVRADTLSALTLWGTANRAGQVTLAPISHVLGAP